MSGEIGMDVSRYSFLCQKALHQGLQYAKSFGHESLEVEHVALALLRADCLSLPLNVETRLQAEIRSQLAQVRKVFGDVSIKFGVRLDRALDVAEEEAGEDLVTEELLWKALCAQSTLIQNTMARDEEALQAEEGPRRELSSEQSGRREAREKPAADKAEGSPLRQEKNETKGEAEKEEKQGSVYKIPEKLEKILKQFTQDLTELAERGELDPVLGRDAETRRVLEILGRKKKNNPILIGEPGVGKTAVAESVALRIAEGRVPEPMKRKRVLSLDLGALVAGAKFRGEFEERMKNLLKAVRACGGDIILFVDEIHMLVGAGSAEGSADAANLMKPALARGELRCLGATTLDEYRQYIEKDPALVRRFQEVMVGEPGRAVALSIMRGLKSHYEIHHGVQINDEALVSAVDLSIRYLPARRLPDKAIDLLDESCSRLRLQIDSVPSIMDDLKSQIDQYEIEKKAMGDDETAREALRSVDADLAKVRQEYAAVEGIWRSHQSQLERLRKYEKRRQELQALFDSTRTQGEFDFAARLRFEEIPRLETKLTGVREDLVRLRDEYSWLRQVVGSPEIAEVISTWTRIPVSQLLKDESRSLLDMENRLRERVFGQDEALGVISRAMMRSRVGVNDPDRPLGVFLFLGPTGVGKTEAAKALAEELFDSETRMVRIDMSEFMEQHSVSRLTGSPPGYVGYGEGGELTEPVRRNPYTVVLLDEIEKAHPRMMDVLLQLFDDGRLTDARGRLVDFRNAVVIMTSNLPLELSLPAEDAEAEEEKRKQLTQYLRPEFVGRIDEIIVFRPLGRLHFDYLMNKLLQQLNKRLKSRQFRLELGERFRSELLKGLAGGSFGGRALRRLFQQLVVDKVSERILTQPELCKGFWRMELNDALQVEWSSAVAEEDKEDPASG
ncbi:MAG: AAA family ATPase [Deltaproteobacteria bacterium]|nr:AAA family ATPase [Deltaproteobacteria bacterium]